MGRGGGTVNTRGDHGRVGKKITIIVVDDEPDVVDTTSTLLVENGIDVIAKAYDGEEAAQQYFEHKPDVILLDMSMPNYDGIYAIEKIKLKDPNAKIIVVSAYLDKYFPAEKVSAVLSKPVDMDILVEKIKKMTG